MMEKMIALQQKRRSKKGGFTLVELIVVLVILAILAALLIPTLTGYIDRAKEKNVIAETRQCVMAAQTLYDEAYAGVAKNGKVEAPANDKILALVIRTRFSSMEIRYRSWYIQTTALPAPIMAALMSALNNT